MAGCSPTRCSTVDHAGSSAAREFGASLPGTALGRSEAILRVITANESGGYKKRLLSSSTQTAELESLQADEPEAYSHNQGLFVV